MNSLRLVAALVAFGCLLGPMVLLAQDDAPFTMGTQYSADVTIITKSGLKIEAHTYLDGDKLRSETKLNGTSVATVVRKDTKKLYHIVTSQNIVMESNFDPAKATGNNAVVYGPTGKFKLLGAEGVDGVPAAKYEVTASDGKVSYFWMELATKAPLQMASKDGAMTVQWKNYKPGPQDPKLFEPPASYQLMAAPTPAPANAP